MARQFVWALAALVLLSSAAPTANLRQSDDLPHQTKPTEHDAPGGQERSRGWLWWKDKNAVAELRITPEQAADIDSIFRSTMEKARPLRQEVNQLEAALNQTIKANTADVSVVTQQVDKVESKRAELNKMRVVMLYRMHKVLSQEQNVKFQAMVDRWEASRKKQDTTRRK